MQTERLKQSCMKRIRKKRKILQMRTSIKKSSRSKMLQPEKKVRGILPIKE
jgi:hypothetical protein